MAKNIKDITKELMGSSLNSFHKKTGLKQLENNNEAQTRVLDGIYSQVDNAYIEKTEQSRIIHLEGSDNGTVEIKSVEGNTLINMLVDGEVEKDIGVSHATKAKYKYRYDLKDSTDYIITFEISGIDDGDFQHLRYSITEGYDSVNRPVKNGKNSITINSHNIYTGKLKAFWVYFTNAHTPTSINPKIKNITVMERPAGEIPTEHIDGIKSSFEEHVTSEGKYKCDITLNNKNLFNINEKDAYGFNADCSISGNTLTLTPKESATLWTAYSIKVRGLKRGGKYTLSAKCNYHLPNYRIALYEKTTNRNVGGNFNNVSGFTIADDVNVEDLYLKIHLSEGEGSVPQKVVISDIMIENNAKDINYAPQKQNKITILLEQPLRGLPNAKDRLCIIDNKLMVERNCAAGVLDGTEGWSIPSSQATESTCYLITNKFDSNIKRDICICDKLAHTRIWSTDNVGIAIEGGPNIESELRVRLPKSNLTELTSKGAKQYFAENNHNVVYPLLKPVYEEVTNEFGEPIILKGYENGTVYIDSLIPPTTTVRYTPKNQTFKALKNVNTANAELAFDINSNVLPYIMELDSMILEKELIQNYKMKMEALDMTSMQERTFNMLARLIRGKSLTKEEAKDRVLLYETANRITSKQALELMVIIEETYA